MALESRYYSQKFRYLGCFRGFGFMQVWFFLLRKLGERNRRSLAIRIEQSLVLGRQRRATIEVATAIVINLQRILIREPVINTI